jgi:glycosyltransferase involved in cell wall biosynthesis
MRILLITREYPPYVKGGMSGIVVQMAKRSRQLGIHLTIIANHPQLKTSLDLVNGIPVYRLPWLGSTFLTQLPSFGYYASRLVKKLQDNHDVVYSNFSPLLGMIKRPFIVGFHATRFGEAQACKEIGQPIHSLLNRAYIPFDKTLINKADGIIALSEKMAEEIKTIGHYKKNIEVISSGVDTNIFRPLKHRNFSSPEKRVLYVGRLDSRKGVDILIHALKLLIGSIKATLIVAGEGKEREKLCQLADSLSIPVDFIGAVPHESLPEIYNSADLFVLPSLYEGHPLVALEAMACGTPTIVSDASPDIGIPRFKRGSVEELHQILLKTLFSEETLSRLSKTSLGISKNYSWDHIVDQTFSFIRKFV